MDFDDLGRVWRQQGEGEPRPDFHERLAAVRGRVREVDQLVRIRDRVETVIALLLLPLFGWLAVDGRSDVSRVGAALIALACVLIPVRLKLARRRPDPNPARMTVEVLKADLERVRAQERLLGSVLWWYLAPLGVGVILFVGGAGGPALWNRLLYPLVVAGFFAWLWRLNRRAVEQQLRPRARELEQWIASLEE